MTVLAGVVVLLEILVEVLKIKINRELRCVHLEVAKQLCYI